MVDMRKLEREEEEYYEEYKHTLYFLQISSCLVKG